MAMDFGMTGVASPTSAAGAGLGDLLGQQQQDETEEQRKKRLSGQQDQPGTSAAVRDLFGGLNTSLGSIGGRGRV
jgi:hypothetical protein